MREKHWQNPSRNKENRESSGENERNKKGKQWVGLPINGWKNIGIKEKKKQEQNRPWVFHPFFSKSLWWDSLYPSNTLQTQQYLNNLLPSNYIVNLSNLHPQHFSFSQNFVPKEVLMYGQRYNLWFTSWIYVYEYLL